MAEWLLNRLFDAKSQLIPRFAFQGTLNWMKALALLVSSAEFSDELAIRYTNVEHRAPNPAADTQICENLLIAMHNIAALTAINKNDDRYDLVRSAIVAWHDSIYSSTSAMVHAASDINPKDHRSVAIAWHNDIIKSGLAIHPFGLSLDTLVGAEVEKRVKELRGDNPHVLDRSPNSLEEAWGASYSYLKGTADYERALIEEKVKDDVDFKKLGVDNFRTKHAREFRDAALSEGVVNFLIQAFRYRGKASYRDSIYLSYGDGRPHAINQFTENLETVAKAHMQMAIHYAIRRAEKATWDDFVNDMENNLKITFDTALLKVDPC